MRTAQITSLNNRVAERQEHLHKLQEKEPETLRLALDHLHANICEIQREMARLWTEYTARMSAAQMGVQVEVKYLQKPISLLEQENNKSQSFLAPIRRLPTELLAEIFYANICEDSMKLQERELETLRPALDHLHTKPPHQYM